MRAEVTRKSGNLAGPGACFLPNLHLLDVEDFRVMGSDATVVVVGGPPGLTALARRRLEALEERWSRFLPASEVSLLNGAGGRAVSVSAETIRLVTTAVEAWSLTEGAYDPTVLGDVLRAGYTVSFESLPPPRSNPVTGLRLGAGGIMVDSRGGTVQLPRGVGFDPGGIGKGLAADMVAEVLLAAGAGGVCVNVGGDLRVAGRAPRSEEGGWTIGVENPFDDLPAAVLGLAGGGVATSSRLRRRWAAPGEADGTRWHHLIDPRTGRPASSGLATVTVVAAKAWQAEALAKAAFLAGPEPGAALLERFGAAGLLIADDGSILPTAGLAPFRAPGMESERSRSDAAP